MYIYIYIYIYTIRYLKSRLSKSRRAHPLRPGDNPLKLDSVCLWASRLAERLILSERF